MSISRRQLFSLGALVCSIAPLNGCFYSEAPLLPLDSEAFPYPERSFLLELTRSYDIPFESDNRPSVTALGLIRQRYFTSDTLLSFFSLNDDPFDTRSRYFLIQSISKDNVNLAHYALGRKENEYMHVILGPIYGVYLEYRSQTGRTLLADRHSIKFTSRDELLRFFNEIVLHTHHRYFLISDEVTIFKSFPSIQRFRMLREIENAYAARNRSSEFDAEQFLRKVPLPDPFLLR